MAPVSTPRASDLPPTDQPMTEEQILFCLHLAELCDGKAVLSV